MGLMRYPSGICATRLLASIMTEGKKMPRFHEIGGFCGGLFQIFFALLREMIRTRA